MSLFRDWRKQLSWGRVCAAVSLAVAVAEQFRGAGVAHVALWLSVAVGNYSVSKFVEAITTNCIGAAASVAPGVTSTDAKPSGCAGHADGGNL
jgi:hypothetical protein